MELKKLEINEQKLNLLKNYADTDNDLVGELAALSLYRYSPKGIKVLYEKLSNRSAKDFLSNDLKNAFAVLAGPSIAQDLPEIIDMCLECQFSSSVWRRSYKSKIFAYHFDSIIRVLGNLIYQSCYPQTVKERLFCEQTIYGGYQYLLALEIKKGNEEIISLLQQAIMGDNTQLIITREIIDAIIISSHKELIDSLLKLLLAAKLQEGIRQNILEAADKGTTQTLALFLKTCLDADLFRYSSAVRAFDVWTGMDYGDNKPASIKKYAQIAFECLVDEEKRQIYYKSENNTEAYFALWAQGCYEIEDTYQTVPELLEDSRHYRQVLGWLFVTRSDNSLYQMKTACRYLNERDEELLAWIIKNLSVTWELLSSNWNYHRDKNGKCVINPCYPDSAKERKKLFYLLKEIAAFIGNKKRTFTGNPFDFISITLESEPVYNCMISLAGYDMDNELIQQLLELSPNMTVEQRRILICIFLKPDINSSHRTYLQNCLNDRSVMVKELTVERFAELTLTAENIDALTKSLRSKSGELRFSVLAILKKQPISLLRPTVTQMLNSSSENQIQAAIELISELKDSYPDLFTSNYNTLKELDKINVTTQTQILLDQLLSKKDEEAEFSKENGFGLYNPEVVESFTADCIPSVQKPKLLSVFFKSDNSLLSAGQIKAFLPSFNELDKLFGKLDDVFNRHANEEIEVISYSNSITKVLFGDLPIHSYLPADTGLSSLFDSGARLDMFPHWDEFKEALGDYAKDVNKMLGLFYLTSRTRSPEDLLLSYEYNPWYLPVRKLNLYPSLPNSLCKKYNRINLMFDIFNNLPSLFEPHDIFTQAVKLYRSFIAIIGEKNLLKPYCHFKKNPHYFYSSSSAEGIAVNSPMLSVWRKIIHMLNLNTQDFSVWFTLEYPLEHQLQKNITDSLSISDFFRAYYENIIPKDVLISFLMNESSCSPRNISILTNPNHYPDGKKLYESYPFTKTLVPEIIDRIVTLEEKRGELPTQTTGLCLSVKRFEGAHHFCRLLAALGKESFFRGYLYSHNTTKKATLSRLLKCCYPSKNDTPEVFASLLKKTDISQDRLAQAVMYAPQWASYAENFLNWSGLKCGVWFFHAHINETFSAEKETEVAIYSPITPQQFNEGAFDKKWFFEAYNQLGEKRFQILYKAAKYITAGANQHRRSQLYSDAVLGKLHIDELMQEITEKRNQEKLRCFPLIPVAQGDKKELLRRYDFIQNFLKGSKQFGSQRRESEKKACQTAMENLAVTAGLMDVNRFMWQMESQKLEEIKPLMTPIALDNVFIFLTIDDNGNPAVSIKKDNKLIKALPKALAKNETYLELKSTEKELKEIKRRSRESLEKAMTESTFFDAEELQSIYENPILSPMLRSLVFTDGTRNGFLQQNKNGVCLLQLNGEITSADLLRIAHPHDLKQSGQWADYMHLLYEKKLVQPFKQVFREYYPITQDELSLHTVSRRYEGHQVQPQRTVSLLKARGWTVDYEEGLQKVFYKENLIVRIYAMADWFSPADIEAPTLETIEFFDRITGKNVALEKVPSILFSETMRDLDLVVSVAHAGGVDPEASHSTTQMRAAIAKELLQLLGISNVTLFGEHAKIHGSLAEYSVHMGSGVVHAQGIGMISILPVHSQARGRIFLPFADNDPKTAEILSKIILLSEDKKIKDPSILRQITN